MLSNESCFWVDREQVEITSDDRVRAAGCRGPLAVARCRRPNPASLSRPAGLLLHALDSHAASTVASRGTGQSGPSQLRRRLCERPRGLRGESAASERTRVERCRDAVCSRARSRCVCLMAGDSLRHRRAHRACGHCAHLIAPIPRVHAQCKGDCPRVGRRVAALASVHPRGTVRPWLESSGRTERRADTRCRGCRPPVHRPRGVSADGC
jgi:hypothetical protein